MIKFRDVVIVVSQLCKAYKELERSHTRREKLEQQERQRRERQRGTIDVEYRVIEE